MGDVFDGIDAQLQAWIERQHVFFVATAPRGDDGFVNCSPKGLDSLRVLDPHTVAYLDLTGSGVETIAHLKENGRIAVMLCAFDGPPRIVRLNGRGTVVHPGDRDFDALVARFPRQLGVRCVIRIALTRISDSCGYAVPLMSFVAEREALTKWSQKKGVDGVVEYQRENNAKSLDGLTGVDWLADGR
jgi:Pyridoxamine 5'-phosphate oxidase